MEFHDILHGLIEFPGSNESTRLLRDLLGSAEINRLRNMRQMNFDVPLIQELGRSRRLPHSIGVANLAFKLSKKNLLSDENSKVLLAAAIMHDAAIPPYGHLVESELKATSSFSHERRVEELVRGKEGNFGNAEIFEGKAPEVLKILEKHKTDVNQVMALIRPSNGSKTPISADIDLDNIDNVHRMAAMLGWDNARKNFNGLVRSISLDGLKEIRFSEDALPYVSKWLEFRERIYTMIIAHKECIPYNALQADLVRLAIQEKIISPENWILNEQEFEEKLRTHPLIRPLAMQLITGCEYSLVDYVWFKGFKSNKKLNNLDIVNSLKETLSTYNSDDYGYFVWNEKGLIAREIKLRKTDGNELTLGYNSTSCMIAYVKKTGRNSQWPNDTSKMHWREAVISHFRDLFDVSYFRTDFPETYSGSFLTSGNNEFVFD